MFLPRAGVREPLRKDAVPLTDGVEAAASRC